MKNQSGALLYFSGYPLSIANSKAQKLKGTAANLAVVKPGFPSAIKKNDLANNPKNWDERWFCSYE